MSRNHGADFVLELSSLSGRRLLEVCRGLGVFDAGTVTAAQASAAGGIVSRYATWFEQALHLLAAQGLLQQDGAGWRIAPPATSGDVAAQWQAALARSDAPAWFASLDAIFATMPRLLRGEIAAAQLPPAALPDGEATAQLLAEFADTYLRERLALDADVQLRLLQIGADAATITAVLDRLRPQVAQIAEYRCVDSDPARLQALRAVTADRFVTFSLLDPARPLEAQGVEPASFDLVLANHALSVSGDPVAVLRQAKSALMCNGLLLFGEAGAVTLPVHLTRGLHVAAAGARLPDAAGWQQLLAEEGFPNVSAIDVEAQTAMAEAPLVFVAESDGVIRRESKASANAPRADTPAQRGVAAAVPDARATLERVREQIAAQLALTLQVSPDTVEPNESFAGLGMDSIMAQRVAQDIAATFGIEFGTNELFDYPTLNKLAAFIAREHAAAVAALEPAVEAVPVAAAPAAVQPASVEPASVEPVPAAPVQPAPAPTIEPAADAPRRRGFRFRLRRVRADADRGVEDGAAATPDTAASARADASPALRIAQTVSDVFRIPRETSELFDDGILGKMAELAARQYAGTAAVTPASADRPARRRSPLLRVREIVDRRVAEVLGKNNAPAADSDALRAERAIQSIGQAFRVALMGSRRFDATTVRKLARFISRRHAEATGGEAAAGPRRSVEDEDEGSDPPRAALRSENDGGGADFASVAPRPAIAIIGMSGRYPRSPDVQTLWQNLAAGRDLLQEMSRWPVDARRADGSQPRGGFLDDVDCFDPTFFNISGIEATYMDPQQRVFLEETWTALEDAGYAGESVAGMRCGVYAGYNGGDYRELVRGNVPPQALWGVAGSILSARIAYHLDLQGPAITVDTACSASLVAVHLACQALWNGETDMALAGGVFVQSTPEFFLATTHASMISPHGRCFTFDERADGFVAGEGAGVVVLKRLEQALAERDHVRAVIRGSAINQDGATNGITAPSARSQERLQREVYDSFGIDPDQITLVEAHGTGTRLGDPIEIAALTRAFRHYTQRRGYCAIGSIKTNIGHTTAAAGVASLIKAVLCLEQRRIPPSLNFERPNPQIDFAASPFYVNTALREWDVAAGQTRMAAISSFGFSGTNAHLVVAEAPPRPRAAARRSAYLFVLSARSPEQLRELAARVARRCAEPAVASAAEVSFTLLSGRRHLPQRLACVAASPEAFAACLHDWLTSGAHPQLSTGNGKPQDRPRFAVQVALAEQSVAAYAQSDQDARDHLRRVAEVFVQGAESDLAGLFAAGEEGRVGLPAYPFARDRFWISAPAAETPGGARARLHPLVHENVSSLWQTRYRSTFSASEAAHPDGPASGVAFLGRLAQAAADLAVGADARHEIAQIELLAPPQTTADTPLPLRIDLDDVADDVVGFAIVQERDGATTPLCRGTARLAPQGAAVIDLAPSQGAVIADLPPPQGAITDLLPPQEAATTALLLVPEFVPAPAAATTAPEPDAHWIVLADVGDEATADAAAHAFPDARVVRLDLSPEDPGPRFRRAAEGLFDALQSIISANPRAPVLLQLLVARREDAPELSALSGMLRTAQGEQPLLRAQLIVVAGDEPPSRLIERLAENRSAPEDYLRYTPVGREAWTLRRIDAAPAVPVWKPGGVYLVTGGSGGLGRLFAQEIAQCVSGATVILAGRSAPAQLAATPLAAAGARIVPLALDVADGAAVDAAIVAVLRDHGRLDGVIHAAGLLRDAYVLRKPRTDIAAVFAPKVDGVLHLDRATAALPLDFFVLFSAGAGVFGNAGQADYACANAFLDAFAQYRARRVVAGERRGRTLSLAWPLWADGGMQVDAATLAGLRQGLGLRPLPTRSGIDAFYAAFASGAECVVVASVEAAATAPAHASAAAAASVASEPAAAGVPAAGQLHDAVLRRLRRLLSELVALPFERIDGEEPLERYGLDSLLVTQINGRLGEVFGDLSKTLLYEHQTLAEVAAHLCETQAARCAQWTAVTTADAPAASAQAAMPAPARVVAPQRRSRRAGGTPGAREPVAIIGISGSYPGAPDLDVLWQRLSAGVDAIGEIPAERWDVERHFSPDRERAGSENRYYSRWGGFLEGFADFDPLFFGLSPRDALNIDPQERLFLQSCWATLEDAGYTRERLARQHGRRVGVFAGITKTGYELLGPELWATGQSGYPHTSFSSLANRVSYLLNLCGPSMPLDTMCSASATAIHEACEHLLRDECELALAGGVNLYLHPSNYVALCAQRMLSSDGRCRSFGAGGDGFVPGEGVGSVLLKPLSAAERDGDRIHALIRASGINHGGKTNGYTVPSPTAQAALIRATLDKAGIDARDVSYIEAHGTGTVLGDPIEVAGLSQAFAADTAERGFCALGSIKSNIGHLESAAGIAGLSKIVLQLRHGQIAPTLHAATANPNIDFGRSAFVLQQALGRWQPSRDGRALPRIAGLSSFGAGGANAHIVIEEYRSNAAQRTRTTAPALIVLSARSEPRLRAYAENVLAALRAGRIAEDALEDVAYTLQTGREAFEERLGLIVHSVAEAGERLADWLAGRPAEIHRGSVRPGKDALQSLGGDDQMQAAVQGWLARQQYGRLLELWVQGLAIDWELLHAGRSPRRIGLPTYPFAPERYWPVEAAQGARNGVNAGATATLHPLLHANTSDLRAQRYESLFTGDEFFFADHVIAGRRVLPGAAYLEMARAAVRRATHWSAFRLCEVLWLRPLVAPDAQQRVETATDAPLRVSIELDALDDTRIGFEISTTVDGEAVVHCRGEAVEGATEPPAVLDLARLQQACAQACTAADCYAQFAAVGMHYGPRHRALQGLWLGQDQVLAQLRLPAGLSLQDYVLHPALLDGALQSAIGFSLAAPAGTAVPSVPFALGSVSALQDCPAQVWVWLRPSAGSALDDAVRKLDVDVCDDEGRLCLSLRGFATRALSGTAAAAQVLLFRPRWQAQATVESRPDARSVLLCGWSTATAAALAQQLDGVDCVALPAAEGRARRFETCAKALLQQLQSRAAARAGGSWLLQVLVPEEAEELAGLAGLLRTASLENPQWLCQLLRVPADAMASALAAALGTRRFVAAQDVAGDAARPQALYWEELPPSGPATSPWRAGGVYWISGGAGGLGWIFAQEIARSAEGARLVLSGRSALSAEQTQQLEALRATGVTVDYRQTDVSDRAAVDALVAWIHERHGALHGIVHSAGVLRDNYLLKKSVAELDAVFAPKVAGLVNVDEATHTEALDFLVVFSSVAGALGNAGQGDYAAANGFMDGYVRWRNGEVAAGRRHGRSVSIDWPLWAGGGMRVDGVTQDRLRTQWGMDLLAAQAGIEAFHRALASGESQLLVLNGAPERLRGWMRGVGGMALPEVQAPQATPAAALAAGAPTADLVDRAIGHFKRLLSGVLKLPASRIDADAPLEAYGIDSILVTDLTAELERTFGALSKTLFFEYQTLRALVGYFVQAYPAALEQLLGVRAATVPARAAAPAAVAAPVPALRGRSGRWRRDEAPRHEPASRDGIAIIGLAGRYPQARTLQAFWDNLKAGRDCIEEIPASRWDWQSYAQAPISGAGKSYCRWGGFVDGVDEFDPLFFNISPREALVMDPQERLFLQCAYAAIEDAGYTRQSLGRTVQGQVGVYVGVMYEEYPYFGIQAQQQGQALTLSGSAASIANRVSYYGDFHGPSMAVDSMCSSSLTTIHLACESLRRGECALALAGGVNVSIHPNKYLMLQQGQFSSTTGRCESFGEGGDGYVPGEGVGAVLLKPLAQAQADGDHLYGVIRGSALNHGGKTNGYTVPNPSAQSAVIVQALAQSGVDASRISYVEAHGTGTSLGDPIEVAGLKAAYAGVAAQSCVLGSVKSNIGHCESAAGIAGLTKVLLQLKHGQLVPSLHSRTLNPNIDFSTTPFVVVQELQDWPRKDGELRLAGISSFGAGGANAHVVVEEYPLPARNDWSGEQAIVLSARTAGQLREQAQQLLAALDEDGYGEAELADIAYTLQVGREALDERLGLIVDSVAALRDKLQAWLDGAGENVEGLYQGQARANREALSLFTGDEQLQQAVQGWLAANKRWKLVEAWVKGLEIDWSRAPEAAARRRLPLPTYPFARQRYWAGDVLAAMPALGRRSAALHPLLQQNTSTLAEQRYSSTFEGDEFFLADHVIGGRRLLPGVACLEMARAAAEQALPAAAGQGVVLSRVVWLRPIVQDEGALTVHIRLEPADDEGARFEIFTETADGETVVHCRGEAAQAVAESSAAPDLARLDLAGLQQACAQACAVADCYAQFAAVGMRYGPRHQALQGLWLGQDQVLAQLRLPAGLSLQDYVLHPALLDGALQAAIGFSLAAPAGTAVPSVPFALGSVSALQDCPAQVWAWLRPSPGSAVDDAVRKLDVDVCDGEGRICLRLREFATRALSGAAAAAQVLLFRPHWQAQAAVEGRPDARSVLLCGWPAVTAATLAQQLDGVDCVALPAAEGRARRFETYAKALLQQVQSRAAARAGGSWLLQVVVPEEAAELAGLAGLLRTASLENPQWLCQLLRVPADADVSALASSLGTERFVPAQDVAGDAAQPRALQWQEFTAEESALPWRPDGVYWISGGAGGLGWIFAQEIARSAPGARLVLTGRSALGTEQTQQLDDLRATGVTVDYRQTDVSDRAAVDALVAWIRERHGALHGIVHSAGVLRDNYLLKKSVAELDAVFAPKVAGLVNLDEATQTEALDFLVVFSSVAGALGNAGQGDYAAANGFMDGYVRWRNGEAAAGRRHGRSVSINWPLWAQGGMQVDDATRAQLRTRWGMDLLDTPAGVDAFYRALGSGEEQVLVLAGVSERLRALVPEFGRLRLPEAEAAAQEPVADIDLKSLENYFRRLFAGTLKLPPQELKPDEELGVYGLDSILVLEITDQLEQVFGPLSKTLLFEYKTVRTIADYFRRAHHATLRRLLTAPREVAGQPGRSSSAHAAVAPAASIAASAAAPRRALRRSQPAADHVAAEYSAQGPYRIAIIGVSGRYPQADTLEQFWDNLRSGRDCVSEIPLARWDHRLYAETTHNDSGKGQCRWGGFLDGVDEFDSLFFSISPREALSMEPQERLFLQCAYATIEDAGYTRQALRSTVDGKVGVYVGSMYDEYQFIGIQSQLAGHRLAIGGMSASIANRVSFFCNFQGPSLTLNTMCSSSLYTIHLACQSLLQQECRLALAGGVNVSIHPNKYIGLMQGQFASSTGRCHSFGRGGDGYVPGEGVGAVLLKPLAEAEADGDHIYGVIRSTAVNHGGRNNGYTVPNPQAQAAVVELALQRAELDPSWISYVEAHGTGTPLGDPIEINGLCRAFQAETLAAGSCAVGSVKSNIGHCESAAGIAGVTKVLLQLKHGLIAPSLHSREPNPNIDFATTPFHVPQELMPWRRPLREIDGQLREVPRICGVSAFGAGGANAHIIIEEYRAPAAAPAAVPAEVAVLLSARNADQLRARVQQLATALEQQRYAEDELGAIAYTLQTGREAMPERLALVCSGLQDLHAKLQSFLGEDAEAQEDVFVSAGKNRQALGVFADDEFQQLLDRWFALARVRQLAEVWASGMDLDWSRLHAGSATRPRRVPLPTYPFARKRHWLAPIETGPRTVAPAAPVRLHPLLHRNTSNLSALRFSSELDRDAFYLADHVIGQRRVLPGAVYLEMARAAVAQMADAESAVRVQLSQIVWVRPLHADEASVSVHIALRPRDGGQIGFQIYSGATGSTARVVHCEGQARLLPASETPAYLDIAALQAECTQQISAGDCYAQFALMGMEYGPAQRALAGLGRRDGSVLAAMRLPEAAMTEGPFVLHPSLLDGAFQSSIAIGVRDGEQAQAQARPYFPFAVEEIDVLDACPAQGWAWVRHAAGSGPDDAVRKLDIDICDGAGRVCVRLRKFAARAAGETANRSPDNGLVLLAPRWQPVAAAAAPVVARRSVLLCGWDDTLAAELGARDARWSVSRVNETDPAARFGAAAEEVFTLLRELLAAPAQGEHEQWLQLAVPQTEITLRGLGAMLKTARQEHPQIIAQLLFLPDTADAAAVAAALADATGTPHEAELRYDDGERKALRWAELEPDTQPAQMPWRSGGVYLLTGGAGGLGSLFAQEIAARTEAAHLILTGRSAPTAEQEALMAQLRERCASVAYHRVDVGDGAAVQALVDAVAQRHGALHGVLHSAGVTRDKVLVNKSIEDLRAVFAPKVDGLLNLDRATRGQPLDFLVTFSSTAGAFGNRGQADYAAANAFMDAYAVQRAAAVARGEASGRSLSLNWPYWAEGGMRMNPTAQARMREQVGLAPLTTVDGMTAFYAALASPQPQVVVLSGAVSRLRQLFLGVEARPARQPAAVRAPEPGTGTAIATVERLPPGGAMNLVEHRPASGPTVLAKVSLKSVREHLRATLAAVLFLDVADIEDDRPFDVLGLDSIVSVDWIKAINERYQLEISVTEVYDHSTVGAMATHVKATLDRQLALPAPSAPEPMRIQPAVLSVDAILDQVQAGKLDLGDAERLLAGLTAQENRFV